jgi:hypothetical protein
MTDQTQADNSAQASQAAAASEAAAQTAASQSPPPTATAAAATTPPATDKSASPASRPDWLPESFWDKDKAEAKGEDFKKHLEGLEKAKTDFDAARGDTPAKADDYKAELPKEFKLPDGFTPLPAGTEFNDKDPMLSALRKVANETGMSQKQFSSVLAIEAMRQSLAAGGRIARDQALGENATARLGELDTWFKTSFGEKAALQLNASLFTPDIAKAWEGVKAALTKQGVGSLSMAGREAAEPSDSKPSNWDRMSSADRLVYVRQQQREGARARH